MTDLRGITHQFETATTRAALISAMQDATLYLGFEVFSVTIRLVNIGGGAWRVLMSSFPRDFLNWYDREQILDEDPLLRRAMGSTAPFYSDELDPAAIAKSPKAHAFIQLARQFGAEFFLSCAQHHLDGSVTLVSLGGSARSQPADREAIRHKAAWIVAHLHDALERVVVPQVAARRGQLGVLTRIERSMLELLARGHGAREIARLLEVSPRSVRYHANRVREKLGARSLNQAVSHAIESRQIALASSAPWGVGARPRVVYSPDGNSSWSVRRPSFDMALREVRSASCLELLAQAARRCAVAAGFERLAFILRSPGASGGTALLLTNDADVQQGPEDPGALIRSCLAPRPMAGCVPAFWDEDQGFSVGSPADGVPVGICGITLAVDGCSSILGMSLPVSPDSERFVRRQACFRLARELHDRARALMELPSPGLSEGELMALRQMVAGSSIRKVAVDGHHKERTLRYRLTVTARKLGARNSRHALAIATERGLLQRDMGRLLSRELIRPFGGHPGSAGALSSVAAMAPAG